MLNQKMLAVMADVNTEIAEREELIETIAIALLTRKNLFILGSPGQAKSATINQYRARITGARQYERALSKQTDEDQLFGRIDLSSLIPGSVPVSALQANPKYQELYNELKARMDAGQDPGDLPEQIENHRRALAVLYSSEPRVNTTGKIPESEICFLDEIFKCNDGVLNSLLTALNERKYTNEGHTYFIPTISFFAASNEIPNFSDPQEKNLEALYDRLELKVITENIVERDNRLAVLKNKQSGLAGQISATITLEELLQMQKEVAAVVVPDSVNELADDILCELRKAGITVSDRKYLNYYPIVQAKAWLSGRTEVQSQDLLALKNYLWDKPQDRATVENILTRMCVNPMEDKVNNIRAMALEAHTEFDTARNDPTKKNAGIKALNKLRGELTRLYEMQQVLESSAQSNSEKDLAAELLTELEQICKQAHDALGFTPVPLNQVAALK